MVKGQFHLNFFYIKNKQKILDNLIVVFMWVSELLLFSKTMRLEENYYRAILIKFHHSCIINIVNISFLITANAISFTFSLLYLRESVHVSLTDLSSKFTNLNKAILIYGIQVMNAASSEANGLWLSKTEGQLLSLF